MVWIKDILTCKAVGVGNTSLEYLFSKQLISDFLVLLLDKKYFLKAIK